MVTDSRTARILAAIVALVAWAGLAVQFVVSFDQAGSVAGTLWTIFRYFTIITNLLVAVLFTGIALGRPRYGLPTLVAGLTLAIILVGVVSAVLLSGLHQLTGAAKLADLLLHSIMPVLVPLFWLIAMPKGKLRWRDPLLWTLLPLVYFAYALARGGMDRIYAYPFMDVVALGWTQTAINALLIAGAFLASGFALVWLDRRLGH